MKTIIFYCIIIFLTGNIYVGFALIDMTPGGTVATVIVSLILYGFSIKNWISGQKHLQKSIWKYNLDVIKKK